MIRSLFVANERSGSFNPALVTELLALFEKAGKPIDRTVLLGKEDLPDAAEATAQALDLIVMLTGDGTVSTAADRLAGWEGTLLILPGGTMNLLAHALHGHHTPREIVEAWLAGKGKAMTVPMIRAGTLTAYCGIIAGPTALWGEVREDLRNRDLASLSETVPRALNATFEAPGVNVDGREERYPAIYVEPWGDGLHAYGVMVGDAGDLLRHGLAWLKGDFRDGPAEIVDVAPALKLVSSSEHLDLLVDGEQDKAPVPLDLACEQSSVRFHSILGRHAWR
ncbi:diacylglycerol/lipid kinase family protein [Sphingobium lignivorans]|uniref:DAGKc domain-containing protein n=1 Tax=Sphingobium lignivorans TaxID=2735886 RepID=A0ABR6NCV5_9SPHN|nr:diacylglycerol kinase family protein [Sphingobium lignivorans]MBB5984054.1 hypothetical protein [Sphingobium lignivorans]